MLFQMVYSSILLSVLPLETNNLRDPDWLLKIDNQSAAGFKVKHSEQNQAHYLKVHLKLKCLKIG